LSSRQRRTKLASFCTSPTPGVNKLRNLMSLKKSKAAKNPSYTKIASQPICTHFTRSTPVKPKPFRNAITEVKAGIGQAFPPLWPA